MDNSKNNVRKIIAIIYFVLVVFCGFNKFIDFGYDGTVYKSFDTWDIVGTYPVMLGGLILIYSCVTNNKIASVIAYVTCFLGYFLTYSKLYSVINSINGIIDYNYHLSFYLYIVSLILLIVSIFIRNKDNVPSDNKELVNVDSGTFLLCNMLLGYKEIKYNETILLKIDNNALSLEYKNNETIDKKIIPISHIKNISYNPDLSVNYPVSDNNNEVANLLLSASILGGGLATLGGYSLLNSLTADYNKTNINTFYVINILYIDNKQEHQVKLITKKEPNDFINNVKMKIDK